MMDRIDGLTEAELLAHVQGRNTADAAARIEKAAEAEPALRAELAMMAALKDALKASTDRPDARAFGWKRLEAEIARTKPPSPRPHIWRLAAAALAVVAMLQGAYISLVPMTGEDPLFRTVSQEGAEFGIGVAFAPSAPAAEITAALREAGARIVDGPSAIGLYRLAFDTEAARAAALTAFAASPLFDLVAEEE